MLLESATGLKAAIDAFRLEKASARDRGGYRNRANQLSTPAVKAAALASLTQEFAANGIKVAYQSESTAALGRMAEERLAQFREDPATLLLPDPTYQNQFLPAVAKALQLWEERLLLGWRERIATATIQLPQDVLAALEVVPDYARAVRDLRGEQRTIQQLGQALPAKGTVSAALVTLTRSAEVVDLTWQRISGRDMPDYVLKFIREAGGAGASMAEISTELLDWLRTRNLLASFMIRPRSQ